MKSSDVVIKVENISKCYRIGLKEEMHENFASFFFDFVRKPLKNYRMYRSLYKFDNTDFEINERINTNSSDIIWALRDVSFEIKKGEVVGIIGSNGAGKSTLLKILSKITAPTYGVVSMRGRVSSLLEVGTGFHPELTGRENVYLNGTILGMSKKEVDKKFDEIVEFSGVEKFLDTPVKRFSTGMKVRLAFSVAAHLEPEILMVDEVLAVGDTSFQKKCLGRMENTARSGRTVILVSHNMAAVSSLCAKSIYLKDGYLKLYGETKEVIKQYNSEQSEQTNTSISERTDRDGSGRVKITDLWIEDDEGRRITELSYDDVINLNLIYEADFKYRELNFIITVYNNSTQRVLRFDTQVQPAKVEKWPESGMVSCRLAEPLPLRPGKYKVMVSALTFSTIADRVSNAISFNIVDGDYFGSGRLHKYWPMFLVKHDWLVKKVNHGIRFKKKEEI